MFKQIKSMKFWIRLELLNRLFCSFVNVICWLLRLNIILLLSWFVKISWLVELEFLLWVKCTDEDDDKDVGDEFDGGVVDEDNDGDVDVDDDDELDGGDTGLFVGDIIIGNATRLFLTFTSLN